MRTIEEIEAAIEHLPRDQFFTLLTWLRGRSADEWDREIEADIKAGKFNQLASGISCWADQAVPTNDKRVSWTGIP